eukprot:SAG11_NODE_13036_length_673_cov_0.984321_1_plen_75_part_00
MLSVVTLAGAALPTAPQLAWQLNDTGCIVHYNMATAAGTQGCRSESVTFGHLCRGGAGPPQFMLQSLQTHSDPV